MPIRIPDNLPARAILEAENVDVMDSSRATRQDIRPLRIGLLNLMPNKQRTETQFARLIAATPLQIDLTLVRISDHKSKNTSEDYLSNFYSKWEEVKTQKFDGFIITGAPIAHLPFEEVRYWSEMVEIMNWTQTNVHSPLFICWAVQAALYHFHGVKRQKREHKAFGVFRHQNKKPNSPFLHGFSDDFALPASRNNDIDRGSLPNDGSLEILIDSDEIGICMLEDHKYRALYMLNHFEYDSSSLFEEYQRDKLAGLNPNLPLNYFPNDDVNKPALNSWLATAYLFFQNWINQIYQTTPFEIDRIGE